MGRWYDPFSWWKTGETNRAWNSNFKDGYQFGDVISSIVGYARNDNYPGAKIDANYPSQLELVNNVYDTMRNDLIADREHTEMREDTAYQRGVADMKAAGLNPYTIGSSPASSSSSSVGTNTIATKLALVGSLMDMRNLSNSNISLGNSIIGTVLKGLKS